MKPPHQPTIPHRPWCVIGPEAGCKHEVGRHCECECHGPARAERHTALAKLDDLIAHRDELAEEVAKLRETVRAIHLIATDTNLGAIETIEAIINLTEEVK